ncbi:MAG: isoleucine--tRNA ligase [Chitinophagales bacterium]|nr:isoleucine--tRNA ligase [Chitinophagales bacterium]
MKYKEFKQYNASEIEKQIANFWNDEDIFKKSVSTRADSPAFVFYEGPPSANGMPGIHHVLARTIKDIFCRFKTIQGFQVQRKAGWDTHGLPIELQVEKSLGITKKDIGTKITVEDYNKECRKEVMRFKDKWDDLTKRMAYWVDLDDPYITYENKYIESVWYLLKELYKKEFLYKGLKIQPFSPAAGTGLSSAELNMPGAYQDVKDVSCIAQFYIKEQDNLTAKKLFDAADGVLVFLAWTTTPWTLPSNTALAVGKNIDYVQINTINQYTNEKISVVLAKNLVAKYFNAENETKDFSTYQNDGKNIPYYIVNEFKGSDLLNIRYHQLLNYVQPENGDAFKVISGDFVTTEDGTGIVHIAPSFGADDMKVADENGIGSLTLVDRQGKFVDEVTDFAGRYVKDYTDDPNYVDVNVDIVVKLKKENKAFKVEKYEHNYPHCWRTDKPIIYYPLDSWFIKVTAVKDKLIEHNKTINWKPESTGTGRFGQWLENLVDWNLSRTRFWGTPLPIWRTLFDEKNPTEKVQEKCIGSIEELQQEIQKSIDAGIMIESPFKDKDIDLHKPYVDDIILVSDDGKPMYREQDLIDVWFDSGAMPYAQWHFPFENKEAFERNFPADFIAEGVDQTRGWFYTLHAIAVMLFDSVAYKNVVSNGLVLDKEGNKMSKRLGNAVDPFETIEKYGADALRWYMIGNGQPWDNLKFNIEGIVETQRKLFGTLYNSYNFFAIYANVDGFEYNKKQTVPFENRAEIDKWILSRLNNLMATVTDAFEQYEPTRAARAIDDFVIDDLSNWFVRLSRRRFWDSESTQDKKAAFETLFECLLQVSQLMSAIAPYFAEWLYKNLTDDNSSYTEESIHLTHLVKSNDNFIDESLEQRMDYAKSICSLALSLRKKSKIKVRQPLQKILIPVLDKNFAAQIEKVKSLILSEINVKEIELIEDASGIISKKVKPNFKLLGKKLGSKMKEANLLIQAMTNDEITQLEQQGTFGLIIDGESFVITREEVEIISDDIEGWLVATDNGITVALDIHLSDELLAEGYAREIINKVQNERKEMQLEVIDKIIINVQNQLVLNSVVHDFNSYICTETLCEQILFHDNLSNAKAFDINGQNLLMTILKS